MTVNPAAPIDVWNPESYDPELQHFLAEASPLISAYHEENLRLAAERAANHHLGAPKDNSHGRAYSQLKEKASALMETRRVRAYHYTRLIAREVEAIRHGGMQPMTIAAIRIRLTNLVEDGLFDAATGDALFAASPYHRQLDGNRENRIWLTTQPYPTDDDGISEFLGKWGGESVAFNHLDGSMADLLAAIGTGAIIEVDLPLHVTTRALSVAVCIIDMQAKSLGFDEGPDISADLVAVKPIEAEWILAVHIEGDPDYAQFGRLYPPGLEQ